MVSFDLKTQINLLLIQYYDLILSYHDSLETDNGDILYLHDSLRSRDPLILNLHLSTDGGQLFRYKKQTVWPVHATLLDLPLDVRCKKENILLLCLWLGKRKPHWSILLKDYLSNSVIGKTFSFAVKGSVINVKVNILTSVFDLPAVADTMNHIQYNGKFGCLYCRASGTVVRVGRGHSRKYGGVVEPYSDESYKELSELANETGEIVFGVKGKSCLDGVLKIPSHVTLDPLHLIFENCTKSIVWKLIDSSSFRECYYLGRHLSHYDTLFKKVSVPHFIGRPRSLSELSFWKARDLLNFLFYFSIPSIFLSLFKKSLPHQEHSFHLLSFILASRLCYSPSARSHANDIKKLFTYFHSRLSVLYGFNVCSINMHLLLHLGEQVNRFGSLPYCSMFPFENQFYNYKVYTQGNQSFLKQLSEKISLLKFCKCFLSVSDYDKKRDILQILLPVTSKSDTEFFDEGHVTVGTQHFYSSAYKQKSPYLSTVYAIERVEDCDFAYVRRFQLSDGHIVVEVDLLASSILAMLDICCMSLPDVPNEIVALVESVSRNFYTAVINSRKRRLLPFQSLLFPCVVVEGLHPNVMLVMPCNSIKEFH